MARKKSERLLRGNVIRFQMEVPETRYGHWKKAAELGDIRKMRDFVDYAVSVFMSDLEAAYKGDAVTYRDPQGKYTIIINPPFQSAQRKGVEDRRKKEEAPAQENPT
jgi:hypothetical protein